MKEKLAWNERKKHERKLPHEKESVLLLLPYYEGATGSRRVSASLSDAIATAAAGKKRKLHANAGVERGG